MGGKERLFARIGDGSEEAVLDSEWQSYPSPRSTELALIEGIVDDKGVGTLSAAFVIERDFDDKSQSFVERAREVRIRALEVQKFYRRRGLARAMVSQLEVLSRSFGASKITGAIVEEDLNKKPWLPEFYTKLGFTVSPIPGIGSFLITKEL